MGSLPLLITPFSSVTLVMYMSGETQKSLEVWRINTRNGHVGEKLPGLTEPITNNRNPDKAEPQP